MAGSKPPSCSGCALDCGGKGFYRSTGSGANGILLVSDTPWDPISVGQLERVLRRGGLDAEMFGLHSVISCNPPKGKLAYQPYETGAVMHCASNLDATIARLNPRVIVPMGEIALQRVAGVSKILRYRGRVLEKNGRFIIPTFHPRDLLAKRGDDESEGLRNPPRFTGVVIWDLKKAVRISDSRVFGRLRTTYLKDPSPESFALFAEEYESALATDSETRLSWDIETPYKLKKTDEDEQEGDEQDTAIIRISFSFRPGHAASVPWSGPYLPVIRRLLRSRGPMVVWNGDTFDVPLVRGEGVEVLGRVEDYMWAFHIWQSDLPKGLEWVTSFFSDILPWKHLNNDDPALYSCIDADAALRNAIGLKTALENAGQWELFQQHVADLDPILYDAGKRGNLIDQKKRETLIAEFEKERDGLINECQGMVPEALKPRKRYKKLPGPPEGGRTTHGYHDVTGEHRYTISKDEEWRHFVPVLTQGKVKQCSYCKEKGVKKGTHFKGGKKNPCKQNGGVIEVVQDTVIEWDEILPFNPNSSDQLKAYIKHHNHPVGTNIITKNESADTKHLKKLVKRFGEKHPIYEHTIKIHKVSKARSTYIYTPDSDGLIHTTYDHTPSTGRLASKNVNLQNVGKRDDNPYAKAARDQIIARPGHIFVGADSSAIEAVMVGWFMGDENYIRLARLGVHDYIACFGLGYVFDQSTFSASDIEKVKYAVGADVYKNTRNTAKRTVHLTNYGGTPGIMVEQDPDRFPTKPVAARWQQTLFDAVPNLKRWQTETRIRAHKEGHLRSPWNYVHYFFDVYKKDPRTGETVNGKDANKAVAFLPQNSAAAFMKDNLLILGASKWRPYIPANVAVHDGYTLEVPVEMQDEAEDFLVQLLTRPIPQMSGLRVGCECERGFNWGSGMEITRKVEVA